jgi:hypothetical protein
MGKMPEAAQKPMVEVLEMGAGDKLLLMTSQNLSNEGRQTIADGMESWLLGAPMVGVLASVDRDAKLVVVRQKQSPDQRERGNSEVAWPFGGDTTGDPLRAKWAGRMSERRTFTFMEPSGGVGARVVGKVASRS